MQQYIIVKTLKNKLVRADDVTDRELRMNDPAACATYSEDYKTDELVRADDVTGSLD